MLYLDYGRRGGEWRPNQYGGNINLDAVAFLQDMNAAAFAFDPHVIMVAEESTAYANVTKPKEDFNGLGFNFKWNMGWMHDMVDYMSTDPLFRKGKHNNITFSLTYAFSENFVLPLSHDEVVHGKCSLINKMPGDYADKFHGLRAFYGYMMTHPGKKLLFMGGEFGQFIEWDEKKELDWFLLDFEKHQQLRAYVRDLNHYYLDHPALWSNDTDWQGFQWIACDDSEQSVISFRRIDEKGKEIIVVCNFCPVERTGYEIGVPKAGTYVPVLSSDDARYGGTGTELLPVKARKKELHGLPYAVSLTLPAMSTVFYERKAGPRAAKEESQEKDGASQKPRKAPAKKSAQPAAADYATMEDIYRRAGEAPLFVVLADGVEDPHNLGAIIRTAEAAGAHGLIIPKRHSAGLTPAGAAAHLPVVRVPNLSAIIEELKSQKNLWFYCADMDGKDWCTVDYSGGVGLVVGSEGFGVSRLVKEKCDFVVSLPMRGQINSLNASVAAGIVMYEVARQRMGLQAK